MGVRARRSLSPRLTYPYPPPYPYILPSALALSFSFPITHASARPITLHVDGRFERLFLLRRRKREPDADITDTLSLGSAFLEESGEEEMQAALALCGLLRG